MINAVQDGGGAPSRRWYSEERDSQSPDLLDRVELRQASFRRRPYHRSSLLNRFCHSRRDVSQIAPRASVTAAIGASQFVAPGTPAACRNHSAAFGYSRLR